MPLHSGGPPRGRTLALRIQFNGRSGQKVSRTSQDDIQSLLPWLRTTVKSLRQPEPKSTNVFKRDDAPGVIEMFWDYAEANSMVTMMVTVCSRTDPLTLQEMSIDYLMVFKLPVIMREIPTWKSPLIEIFCPPSNSTIVGPSGSHPASTVQRAAELEEALLKVFKGIGLPITTPVGNLAAHIPTLSTYLEVLRNAVDSEAAARKKAEAALAEERARHARILQAIQTECREPFVVPALLEAFVAVSQIVDGVSDPPAE